MKYKIGDIVKIKKYWKRPTLYPNWKFIGKVGKIVSVSKIREEVKSIKEWENKYYIYGVDVANPDDLAFNYRELRKVTKEQYIIEAL